MKPRILSAVRLSFPLASAIAALLAVSAKTTAQTNNYFGTTGTLSGNVWSTNPAGPYTSALNTTGGAIINFGNTTTAITGATITVAGINATANATVTTAAGTISNLSNGVVPISVASGITMNFGSQAFTTSATAGYIKNGAGTLTLAGGTYAGGFTLNAGTVAVGGVNAMGSGGLLTINGGTIRSNGTTARDLTGKYANGGIVIGGDFTLGDATNNGALTFTNSVGLGAATRTITVNSGVTFGGIGVISGAANVGLTKAGAGTLTLNGTNTFDGVLTISAGTLAINTFTNGGVAGSLGTASNAASNLVLSGGGLSYSGVSTTTDRGMTFSALTGSLTLSVSTAASNLNLTSAIVGTPGQQIDFTKGGGGTLTLSNDNNSFIGRTLVNGGTLAVTSISAVGAGNSSLGVATSAANGLISLGTGTTAGTLSHVGTGSTTDRNLDLPGTTGGGTISQSGTGLLKFTGTFGASGAGSKTLTLTGSTAGTGEIASAILDNSVTNTTALAKTGTGTWALTGANAYTGATTVSAGTLDLGGGTATGSLASPTLTLNAGTFSYTRTGSTTQAFTTTNINGPSQLSVVSGNILDLGTIVRGVRGTLDFAATGAGTVAALAANNVNGIIPGFSYGDTWAVANGAGTAITGLGTFTLTSVASTTGTNYLNANVDVDNDAGLIDTAITANSVRFSSAADRTLALAAGTNTLAAGGILVSSTVGGNLSTITGGTLTGAPNQNLAIIQNNTLGGLTISSGIVNNTSTSVTKLGAGLLTIDAANTYTGGTTVAAGTLKLSGAGTLGPVDASVAVNSGAVLDLNGTNQSITFAAGNGVGTAANNSGGGTSVLTLKATTVTDAGFLTIADSTSTPGGKVAVVVANNMQIPSNLNSYSGGTTVNAGAFFYLNFSSTLGAGTGPISLPASGASTSLSSGLLVDGGGTYANDISGAGYVHNNSGSAAVATLTGNVTTSGNFNVRVAGAGFNFAGSGSSSVSGNIGPAGASNVFGPNTTVSGAVVVKSGTGTLTLSGTNAYTGSTTINGGTLRINSAGGAIPNAGLVTLADASGVNFEVLATETIGALAGGGASGGAVSIDPAQTLTLSSGTQTYAGTISGAGVLTNGGAVQTLNGVLSHTGGVNVTTGTLTLGNAGNTYSGATAISAATAGIIVSANGALGATGTGNGTSVGANGVLGFSGGITYSTAETVSGSGPGTTPSGIVAGNRGFIQSVSGNNTFAGNIELAADGVSRIGTQDGAQLNLTGTISQASGITTASVLFRAGNLNGDFVTLSNAGNSFGGDSSVFTSLAVAGQYTGLRIGVDNAHPTNLTVQNFSSASGISTALDLNGNDQALNGLSSGGAGSLNVINLDTVNASTLTLNPTVDKNSGANIVILGGSPGGTALGAINLVKDGAFNQTLSGVNTYTGTTTINAGTLTINEGSIASSSGIVNNAALVYNLTTNARTYANVISGSGTLTKSGTNTLTLSGANTYTGNTVVSAGTLALADNAQLKFVLGNTSGSNNSISGAGTVTLEGDFVIETSAADALASGTWTLENVTSLAGAYGANFTVAGFTDAGSNKWTKPNGAKLYTFDETTGILTLGSAASYASWIGGFGLTGLDALATADPDFDGIPNAVEMVIGGNPATGMDTALLPTIELVNADPDGDTTFSDYLLFTYRRSDLSVAAGVTADCETDTDLAAPWTAATGAPGVVIQVDNNFAFTPPAAADTDRVRVYVPRGANPRLFGRLNVLVP